MTRANSHQETEAQLKARLTPLQYKVLRERWTEPPFSGEYVRFDKRGGYACAACGNMLFSSGAKFDSHCGWPSFSEAKKGSVELVDDRSHWMRRTEVRCSKCGGHLGHIFDDGPKPAGKRYCINSAAMQFSEQR
jgi:peptide-methionine (R)-S-oxide reductase